MKLPLKIVEDAQGPMGIVDATGKAVAWFSDLFTPSKGYAWEPTKEPGRDGTHYTERNNMVLTVFRRLTMGWRKPEELMQAYRSPQGGPLKLLLLMVPHRHDAVIGWHIGGHWYEQGSCAPVDVIMWQPLPELPYDPVLCKRHQPPTASSKRSKPRKNVLRAKFT